MPTNREASPKSLAEGRWSGTVEQTALSGILEEELVFYAFLLFVLIFYNFIL